MDKNLEKALDIIARLISGDLLHKNEGNYRDLYETYISDGEVYHMVQTIAKKLNISLYEYNNGLYLSAGDHNQVFGFRNDELRKLLGVKRNRELYLCYFIIYNIITSFYSDSGTYTYMEYIRLEDVITAVDGTLSGLLSEIELWGNETEEASFKTLALIWNDMPVITTEESQNARASKNSKAGYTKTVLNFMISQGLLLEAQDRYYPLDRLKALTEQYFQEHGSRLYEIFREKGENEDAAY